jgi:hemoglobin-like flavoprotein
MLHHRRRRMLGRTVTPEQITLVQNTFRQIAPISDEAAELFYNRLFELDPSLRPLFPTDLSEQRRKLMQTLSVAVGSLRYIDGLVPTIEALARRHATYGVRPEHFDTVGAALLWTLSQGLGPSFTAEVNAAWVAVYTVLADTMKEAMAEEIRLPRAA